jgi:hypothetical protein
MTLPGVGHLGHAKGRNEPDDMGYSSATKRRPAQVACKRRRGLLWYNYTLGVCDAESYRIAAAVW